MQKLVFALIFSLSTFHSWGQSKLLLRHPSINHDGSQVAFSFQGDIWTVPSSGGKATRLTIHEAYEGTPIYSPDGKKIAFSGSRYGNNDVFVVPSEGGNPKRLTYHSAGDNVMSWSSNNQVVFATSREFRQIGGHPEIYGINATGGTESRLLDTEAFDPAYSPDGRFVALVRGMSNPVFREDYRGTGNREIWLYDTKNKKYSKLPLFTTNDIMPRWSGNRSLYFLSSNSGTYNLYRCNITENAQLQGNPEQLTQYKDEGIRHFSLSTDGSTVVFEKDMGLYLMKGGKGNGTKIDVQIAADERFDPSENKTLSNGGSELAISPNGKLMAFAVRGEIFIKEVDKEKSRSVNVSDHPNRDMGPVWLSDTSLVFASDRADGNFEFFFLRSADRSEPNPFKSLKHELIRLTNTPADESEAVVSGDGKKIAFRRGRGDLTVADLGNTGQFSNEKLLVKGWAGANGVTWSPDHKWLAYSMSDLYFNNEIFIHAADNSQPPVNVSMHPRTDMQPFWSADGSKLGFISARSNRNMEVWFAWLKKEDWEKVSQDWQEKDSPDAPAPAPKPGAKAESKPIQIDFDGIHERVVQVTSSPGDKTGLVISKDGQTFFYTAPSSLARGRDLYSIKWDGKELKEITKGGSNPFGLLADKEGKYIYYGRMGGFSRIDAKAGTSDPLPFQAKMKIDYPAERSQIFEEAWRTIRDGFYDPQMHGYDWNALKEKYQERCVNASTNNDFRDMFNYLLGEINASHMALSAPDRAETQQEATGLLGAELMPQPNGMKVNHVIPESPAAKKGSQLFEGDVITAVNGVAYAENANFYENLNSLVNEKVLLNVTGADGKTREVVIRPTANLGDNLYDEWVDKRKQLVDEWSKGRLGYLHIRGMDMSSFEETEREFMAAGYGKDGLVIDVRFNGGGSTADYLMTVLNYKQHAYTIPRGASEDLEKDKKKFRDYYPTGERLVFSAWMKPSVALCNEGSYSNAEIFSHAYKSLGIGKLVGQATNGSVISTGGRGLIDGSFVRLPFRGWFTKTTDKNQELGPAVPDIILDNSLDYTAKGTDEQLKAAVEALLKEIK
jgi:tricorn protease-like protein/C-terminal processing protease CtpA/Prc